MNWIIQPIGKPSFPWVRQGVAEYEKRIRRFAGIQVTPVKSHQSVRSSAKNRVWVLDETGPSTPTSQLADRVTDLENRGIKGITVCIGGADGVEEEVRKNADLVLSLGSQTLMHELALLVWMEQVYRVHTLLAGHPYHREG